MSAEGLWYSCPEVKKSSDRRIDLRGLRRGGARGRRVRDLAQRPPTGFGGVLLLSYAFGGVPALIAGILYGGVSVVFVLVSVFDLLTVSSWTVADLEIRFLRRSLAAGIPAGIVCALLAGSKRPPRKGV